MTKGIETEKSKEPTIFEDAILAGILLSLGHQITPIKSPNGQIIFQIRGNVEKTVQDIYSNCSVGALDVMRSIKLTRSMIFNLRSGKNGKS